MPQYPRPRTACGYFLRRAFSTAAAAPVPTNSMRSRALESWVERGVAPTSIVATKADSPLSRPLCPYPQLPRYKGAGDPNDAASFVCAQ